MQDQLYLNYVEEYQGYKADLKKHADEMDKIKDELREEKIMNERYRKMIKDLKLDPDSMSENIVNLHKKLALLEVDNFRNTKKIAIITEQEKQLREAYHKIEEGFTVREKYATERITKLKEWQIKAINEIKFLYSKFKDAVPLGEYQNISKELIIYKQKFADTIEKCNRQAITNSRLQTENRQLMASGEKVMLYEEIRLDAENELEMIKKRLEIVDPSFKWENAVFNRVIAALKQYRMSPKQAFELFDKDGNGKLSDKEFMNCLEKMGITDLTPKEKELLKRSIDPDESGSIDYREFCRKCGRQGVMMRSREDQIVYVLDEALKRNHLDLERMFDVMDKNGKGVITKEDFKDTLNNSRVKIDRKDIENFVDLFWKGREEGINYRDFVRIYNKFKVRLDEDQDGSGGRGKITITDEMIERMKFIFDSLDKIFTKNNVSLKEAFDKIDFSGDKKITRTELRRLFDNMNVTCTENELEMIFTRMDFDDSGAISFREFEDEFTKIVNTPLENLLALNNAKKVKTARHFSSDAYGAASQDFLNSKEIRDATKLSIVESKVRQLEKKSEMYRSRLEKSEDSQISWERDYDTLEKKYFEVNEKYQELLQKEQAYNTQKIGSLSKEESEVIVLKGERQNEQITDLRAAMESYKSLFEVASGQAKTLKLANKRSRDEEENLLFALRELQATSIDKMKLGRIYYILMLSRWQEAAIGMKYDYALNDVRVLRLEYSVIESRLKKEEDTRHLSENKLREKSLQVEHLKQEIESKSASGISMTRAEEISRQLQEVCDDKADVEEKYIKIYSEVNTMRFKISEYEARMEHSEEMLDVLRHATDTEISERLIEMSEKISQIRKNELRSKREVEEYSEKVDYSERRIGQQKRNIVDLEDQLAELEAKLHRKEEEWRRADNERQKKFFDAQFVNFETENRYKGYVDDSEVRAKYTKKDLTSPPVGEFMIKKEDVRIMQAKMRNQDDEISNLKSQIISKEKQLDRLREWQLEDNLLSEDEKLRDIIDSNKVKIDQMHEKETTEMAQAAHKTIRMLQEMVQNKSNECKRKEEIIKELKEKMVAQKQEDTTQIIRLNDQLSEAVKAHSNAENSFHKTEFKVDARSYEATSRRQLINLLMEKDKEIQDLADKITELERAKKYLLDSKDDRERDRAMRETDNMSSNQGKKVADLRRHIDTLTKKLNSKEKVQERLNDTIQEITNKLIKLESAKGMTEEDAKMDRLTHPNRDTQANKDKSSTENPSRIEELEKMLRQKERRLISTTAKAKAQEKELRELKEKLLKYKETESELRDEVKTGLMMRQKLIDEHEAKERAIKRKERQAKKEEVTQDTGKNTLEMRALMKQVNRENKILKTQTKPIIAYNNESKAFEYIGEPAFLRDEVHGCDTLEELLEEIRQWLKINNRLTVSTIFNNFDYNKSGYIEKELLVPIFSRLGIKLHEKEVDMLFNCLNKDDEDLCKYRPLVLEITTGPNQLEFMKECCVKVAELVVKTDVSQHSFLNEITKDSNSKCTKDKMMDGLDKMFPKDMTKLLVDQCFSEFKVRPEREPREYSRDRREEKKEDRKQAQADADKFTEEVYNASLALAIKAVKKEVEERGREYARDARQDKIEETKGLSLDNEFSRLDKEHDAVITFVQFDQLLDVYGLKDFKENVRIQLKNRLDYDRNNMITLAYIKKILDLPQAQQSSQDGSFGLDMKPTKDNFRDKEDEEIEENARRALKRIYQKNNLIEKLEKQLKVYDNDKDGVVHRNILRQSIQDVTKDVHDDDINYIVQFADKRNKGYFNPEHFMTNLTRIGNDEAKKDAILRRLNNVVKHKGIDLLKELNKFSKNNSGVIDTYDFMRAMRELRIGLDGNDMEDLIKYAAQGEKFIEVKQFCKMVEEAANSKPISITAAKSKKSDIANRRGELSEKEQKKVHMKVQALTNQLIDAKREIEVLEKNVQDWKAIAEKNEKSLNILSDKLLDPKDKLKKMDDINADGKSTKLLKQQLKQQERILELGEKLEDLAKKNEDMERYIKVESQAEISSYEVHTKEAQKRLQAIKSENISLQTQIDKLVSATSSFEKNEEAEYARQMNIKNLEERIRELEANDRDLHEELLRSEHQGLDMKFERENNTLKMTRLQDRIKDLENYIEIYTQLPASMISKASKNKDFDIEKELARQHGPSKRPASELEKVIEGLKRVINTQRAELDQLKKRDSKFKKKDDKVSTNKLLKDEITNLEKELKTIEEKDKEIINLEVKTSKLSEANKALMNDVKNEQKRYEYLEAKYKELLVKFNISQKNLEQKEDSLFTMSTGANRATYQEYLTHKEKMDKRQNDE